MKKLAVLGMVLFLGGCATAYQQEGMSGGFSSTQLDENLFIVTFKGNGYTSREKTNDFALLRSAEITLENGFKFFNIIDGKQYSKHSTYTTPTVITTNLNANTYGSAYNYGNITSLSTNTYGTASSTVTGGETYNISKPRSSNTIICFFHKPDGFTYNAQFIVNSLKSKYKISDSR